MKPQESEDAKVSLIRELFKGVAASYDTLLSLLTLGQARYWRRATVAAAHLKAGDTVLDVATGTGLLAFVLSEAVGRNGLVVGVDVTPRMIHVGKVQNVTRGARIEFVSGRAENLPFREEVFDACTMSLALRNVSDIERTIGEMRRVVRNRGVVVSLDFIRPPNRLFRKVYYLYLVRFMPLLGRLISPAWGRTFNYLALSILGSRPVPQVLETMRRVGLRPTRAELMTAGVVTLVQGWRRS
ncbi:MAG: ubiquinone/menaquinone biosynthesis methyltransferase [Candidatus Geothermarchaeales archaeon]